MGAGMGSRAGGCIARSTYPTIGHLLFAPSSGLQRVQWAFAEAVGSRCEWVNMVLFGFETYFLGGLVSTKNDMSCLFISFSVPSCFMVWCHAPFFVVF